MLFTEINNYQSQHEQNEFIEEEDFMDDNAEIVFDCNVEEYFLQANVLGCFAIWLLERLFVILTIVIWRWICLFVCLHSQSYLIIRFYTYSYLK